MSEKVWIVLWRKPYHDGSGHEGELTYHSTHASEESAYATIGGEAVKDNINGFLFDLKEDELKDVP